VADLLPRFYASLERMKDQRKLGAILLEADAEPHPDSNGRVYRRSADGHNRGRARGIPIVGRVGGGGASPGTDPLAALLRKEARGELR
jgi:hypothetical protein